MKCIYDKTIPCELNPDGPMTKDFVCLKCHKPEKKTKKESVGTGTRANNQKTFNARGKKRKFSPKKREFGRGRDRGRR